MNGKDYEPVEIHTHYESDYGASVKRTLERQGLIRKRSPWKRWHFEQERPLALKPGDLVQIDTIHLIPGALYIYTLIDIFSSNRSRGKYAGFELLWTIGLTISPKNLLNL